MPHTINSQLKVKNTCRLRLDRAKTRSQAGSTAQSVMHQQRSFHPFSIEGILSDRRTHEKTNDNKLVYRCSDEEYKTDKDEPLLYKKAQSEKNSDEKPNHNSQETSKS